MSDSFSLLTLPVSSTRRGRSCPVVCFVPQLFPWDCGLACLFAVANPVTATFPNYPTFLKSLAPLESIWSIDLVHIFLTTFSGLSHFEFRFFTVTPGLNENHTKSKFYSGDWKKDEKRVLERFQSFFQLIEERKANSSSLSNSPRFSRFSSFPQAPLGFQVKKIDFQEILQLLEERFYLIFLVDANWIQCEIPHCETAATAKAAFEGNSSTAGEEEKNSSSPSAEDFCGHFILLTGFNRSLGLFEYFNSALSTSPHSCKISFKRFEAARSVCGTDNDCLALRRFSPPTILSSPSVEETDNSPEIDENYGLYSFR